MLYEYRLWAALQRLAQGSRRRFTTNDMPDLRFHLSAAPHWLVASFLIIQVAQFTEALLMLGEPANRLRSWIRDNFIRRPLLMNSTCDAYENPACDRSRLLEVVRHQ